MLASAEALLAIVDAVGDRLDVLVERRHSSRHRRGPKRWLTSRVDGCGTGGASAARRSRAGGPVEKQPRRPPGASPRRRDSRSRAITRGCGCLPEARGVLLRGNISAVCLGANVTAPLSPQPAAHLRLLPLAKRSSFRPRAQGKGWSSAAGGPESCVSLGKQVSGPPDERPAVRQRCASSGRRRRSAATGPRRRPSFPAIAGVVDLLAVVPIPADLRAHPRCRWRWRSSHPPWCSRRCWTGRI